MGLFYSRDDKQDLFNFYCKDGNIVQAQKIYKSFHIDIHYLRDAAVVDACEYGHLDIAKWLYSLGGVDIHTYDDAAFASSYRNGYKNITKWLYSLNEYHYKRCKWRPILEELFN